MNKFPENWEILPLHSVAEIIGGGTPSRINSEYWGDEHFWITPSEVVALDGGFVYRSKEKISELGLKNSSAKLLPPGTILMTSRASIGYAAIAKTSISTNQGFQSIICGKNLHNLFVLHQIRYRKLELERLAAGSTFAEISSKNLKSLSLLVPPLPEQKKIASILTCFDEVIRTTQKKIRKLQYLKKATIAELMTKGIGHKEFKESDLGKIPKNWEVLNFLKIIQSANQGVNTTTEKITYSSSGINACRSNNIKENSFDWKDRKFVNQSTFARLTDKVKPKLNDVLYCNIGSNLGAAAVVETAEDFIITWNVLRITTDNSKVSSYFLSHLLNSLRKELRDFATESTMPFISSKSLSKFKFKIPPINEQNKISAVIDGINKNLEILKLKLYQIQSLKKSIMQDLLTGNARVKVKR